MIAHDAYIDGIDVDEFVWAMRDEFGGIVLEIPWLDFSDQRASFRGCGIILLPFWLLRRVFVRPYEETILAPPGEVARPRLTVGHLAEVIDQGYWIEPSDMTQHYRRSLSA